MDEIALAYARTTAPVKQRLRVAAAYQAGYTAGLERAAKEMEGVALHGDLGEYAARAIRTLAHPPKEGQET